MARQHAWQAHFCQAKKKKKDKKDKSDDEAAKAAQRGRDGDLGRIRFIGEEMVTRI